jgi:signal transduction histidine kinase/CheY-like chemotaxis protein
VTEGRVADLLEALEQMAGGDHARRAPISSAHDELDAIAHAVNVLVGELQYASRGLRESRDRAEEANRAKTTFLRNVSHEIRTPLSAILGIAQLLHSAELVPARRRDLVGRILSNGRLLLDLVDELLDLSKIESGRIDIDACPMSAHAVASEVLSVLEPEAEKKTLQLSLGSTGGEHFVHADPKRLRQILLNVVGNAIKFTERGEVRVRLRRESPECVHIDVTDTGIGLPPAQAALLFEPFSQADASISRRFGGTGLGLALSRRLARAMGGELAVTEGAPGVGTTVRLTLPGATEPSVGSRPGASAAGGAIPELRGLRVLLADDNEDLRCAMAALLTPLGVDVIEACDGVEAVAIARREALDLVLMDMRMPRLDGIDATRQLRELGLRVPIIALTADAVLEHRRECLAAGCTAHVAKPVDFDALVDVIQELASDASSQM